MYTIQKNFLLIFVAGTLLLLLNSCSLLSTKRSKNIVYKDSSDKFSAQKLDVYQPRFSKKVKPVWIFIHGGNWNSGRKEQYNVIGRNMAAKGIVAVIIDYPLSPAANYKDMARFSSEAVKWTKNNISNYQGDPEKLFISGHSAGGHLASLISLDNRYFEELGIKNPIKGTFLIDAAGLDMYGYLSSKPPKATDTYTKTFSLDQEKWKDASPIFYLDKNMPPMMMIMGGKTYSSISGSTERFRKELNKVAPDTPFIIQKNKKHIPMIVQFFNPWNKNFKRLKRFIKENSTD